MEINTPTNNAEWEKYVKTLPDEVRVGLAEYTAQIFLDGVEKGRKEAFRAGAEAAVDYIEKSGQYESPKHTLVFNERLKEARLVSEETTQ